MKKKRQPHEEGKDFGDRHEDHHRRNRFAVNHDRIYLVSDTQRSDVCKTNVQGSSVCCDYISHESFGGICNHDASKDLLEFPRNHRQHDFGGDRDNHNGEHRPEGAFHHN